MDDKLKVLFIDDDDDDIDLVRRALERDGFVIEWRSAANENSLRIALANFEPQIVLCDYRIPGYCGIAAIDLVHSTHPAMPILLVTGFIEESSAIGYLKKGAADYILKSNLQRLGTAVRRAIADAAGRARVQEAEQSQQRMSEVLEASPDLVVVSDMNGRITFVNEAACHSLGSSSAQLIGSDWIAGVYARSAEWVRNEVLSYAFQNGCWRG